MSNPWTQSTEKDVLYPDDLAGRGPLWIVAQEPLEADDVPHDDAQYGMWAELPEDDPAEYLAAPRQIRELIGEAWEERPDAELLGIEILEAERGPQDHDEWEIEGKTLDPETPETEQ